MPGRRTEICGLLVQTAYGVVNAPRIRADDEEDISVRDLIIPATTDTKALAAKVKEAHRNDRFTVIFFDLSIDRRRGPGAA